MFARLRRASLNLIVKAFRVQEYEKMSAMPTALRRRHEFLFSGRFDARFRFRFVHLVVRCADGCQRFSVHSAADIRNARRNTDGHSQFSVHSAADIRDARRNADGCQ